MSKSSNQGQSGNLGQELANLVVPVAGAALLTPVAVAALPVAITAKVALNTATAISAEMAQRGGSNGDRGEN